MTRFLRTESHAIDLAAVEVIVFTCSDQPMAGQVSMLVGNGTNYDLAIVPADPKDTYENQVASIKGRIDSILSSWRAAREAKR